MKVLKGFVALLLTLALILPSEAVFAQDEFDYVALGDSLAFGITEENGFGKSYADFFGEFLSNEIEVTSFNKGFSFPGYTTVNILEDLQNNVEKVSYGEPENVKMTISEALADAEIITLSVGANDVLRTLNRDEQGGLVFEVADVVASIQLMATNANQILQQVSALSPEAQVYVMGFYNPFPALTEQASQINFLVEQMDAALQQVVDANGMHFVSVKDVLASDFATYLPNPLNIHPSEAGYTAMAEQFFTVWESVNAVEEQPEPTPPITFSDVPAGHWASSVVSEAAARGILKGYPDGTFKPDVTVEKVHFTSILVRPLGLTATKPVAFLDVAGYDAATKSEIAAAHEALIVRNFTGYFNPRHSITRVEVARMLYAANTFLTGEAYVPAKLALFNDINTLSKDDQAAISMLKEFSVTNGYPDGTFRANAQITRAEATAMVLRFLNHIE